MNIQQLKELSPQEQKHWYAVFFTAYELAPEGSGNRELYSRYLEQLKDIFKTDDSTYQHILAHAAADRFEIEAFLDEFAAAHAA